MTELLKVGLEDLKPNPWNTNLLREQEREMLKRQMESGGPEATPPLVVRKKDDVYEIIDGEQRWRVAKELGWQHIYVLPPLEADDLKVKTLCISYNSWRGRQNWFKLCDVMMEDIEAGVNVHAVYGSVLNTEQVEMTLSLANLVPEARKILEQALVKFPEVTLPQLNLLSKFPKDQQKSLAGKFAKEPAGIKALKATLSPFLAPVGEEEETGEELAGDGVGASSSLEGNPKLKPPSTEGSKCARGLRPIR